MDDTGPSVRFIKIAPVVAAQNTFQVGTRDASALLDACTTRSIAFAPFFPLGGGGTNINAPRFEKVAARPGATPPQIALAWLLAISRVTLAIPGSGSLAHFESNVAATSIALTDEDWAELTVAGATRTNH